MRQKLNENPMVQVAVLGIGLVLVAGLLFMRMGGGGEEATTPPATDPNAAAAGAVPPGTSPGATSGAVDPATTPPVGGATGSSTPPVTPSGNVDPQAMSEPGPGLPVEVANAWKRGDAVVLLVVRPAGIDDRLVQESARGLSSMSEVAFFDVRAEKVAQYARITQGVGLNRVPGLVVIRPKDVAGAPPQAQVSYGFRNSQSVVQAVRDALYKGKDDVPYYPG